MLELDLTRKENWNPQNVALLWKMFGYANCELFAQAIQNFFEEEVSQASVTNLLQSRAIKYFSEYVPTLPRN